MNIFVIYNLGTDYFNKEPYCLLFYKQGHMISRAIASSLVVLRFRTGTSPTSRKYVKHVKFYEAYVNYFNPFSLSRHS